ncbi:MAG: cell wall metabolism sensor histidine kinase WalK, partial [Lachnospiraceae bacterium]|nr:cell wall metabolism sensor histidine kinase WalK [Lachnospiraceae bacterium]
MKTVIAFFIRESRVLKSLKFRIFILMMLVGAIPCIILTESIILNYRSRALSVRTTEAMNQSRILANHLQAAGFLKKSDNETILGELNQLSSIYDGRILLIDGDFLVVSDTYDMSVGKTMISKEIIECMISGSSATVADGKEKYIEFAVPVQNPDTGQTTGVMFMSASTDTIRDSVDIFRRKAWIIIITAAIFVFFISIGISSLLVRPFGRVTKAIVAAQEGFDAELVSIPDYTETEAIMTAFNKLMTDMKVLDDSRQEFVANVSHELKTPLASMKVLADSIRGDDSA